MLANLTSLAGSPAAPDHFHVEWVGSDKMLAQWQLASAAGFGHDAGRLKRIEEHPFYAAYARHGYGGDAFSLHAVGYHEDQPVTSATLLLAGGIAGVFDVSTPPACRRQGFGGAITWAMMQEGQKRGYQHAYVWSSSLGRGVYQGVGFVPSDIGMREYQWQKRA
jgi:hypothetical protein